MENIDLLSSRLKYFRQAKNMTRKDVCTALNVTASAISYWESGSRIPEADTLLELCGLYGIRSVGQLFGNEDIPECELSADERELLNLYRKVDREGKHAVVKLLKGWSV